MGIAVSEQPTIKLESNEELRRSSVERLELLEKFNSVVLAIFIFALSAVSYFLFRNDIFRCLFLLFASI